MKSRAEMTMVEFFDMKIAYHQGAYDVVLSLLNDYSNEKSRTPTTTESLKMNLEWHLGLLHHYQYRKRKYEGEEYDYEGDDY